MVDGDGIADSIKQRAKARGMDPLESMRRYAMERLIVRLRAADDGDRTVLKGGMLWWLTEKLRGDARPTTDIDIHFHEPVSHEVVLKLIETAGNVGVDDGCRFDFHGAKPLEHSGEHEGLRVKVRSWIGSKFVDFHIDVGFGGRRPGGIEPTAFESMHPKVAGGSMLMVPLEYVAAEKLHAIVKLGMKNTRLKDYNDLFVMSGMKLDAEKLADAVMSTFEDRVTELPECLPEGFSQAYAEKSANEWNGWLIASGRAGKMPGDFATVVSGVAAFAGKAFMAACDRSLAAEELVSAGKF